MPLNQNYAIHAAKWGVTVMPGVQGVASQFGRESRIVGHAGAAFARLGSVAAYAKYATLSTGALKSFWSKLNGSAGIPCADLSVNGPLTLFGARIDDVLPAFVSGSNHESLAIAKGLAIMRSLSWSKTGGGAVMEIGVWPLSADGDADCWDATAAALPTLPAAEEDYDLHSIALGGSALEGATDFKMTIDTGATGKWNPGKIYQQYISQAPATNLIRIGGTLTLPDRSLLRTWGPHFKGAAVDSLTFSLRPFKQAAARDTANQIDVTLACVVQVLEARDSRASSVSIQFDGISTGGTTSPLSWVIN